MELANNFNIVLKAFQNDDCSEMIYNEITDDWDLF